jgi:hypothetical protein
MGLIFHDVKPYRPSLARPGSAALGGVFGAGAARPTLADLLADPRRRRMMALGSSVGSGPGIHRPPMPPLVSGEAVQAQRAMMGDVLAGRVPVAALPLPRVPKNRRG